MFIKGSYWKEDKFWIGEVASVDLFAQGKTKAECLKLLLSQIEEKYSFDSADFQIIEESSNNIYLTAYEHKKLLPLILKGLRNKEGLSVQAVADRLKFKSRSSYFKYETGERSISFDQFNRIIEAITNRKILFGLTA